MLELEGNERHEANANCVKEISRCVKCPKHFEEDDKCELIQSLVRNGQERVNITLFLLLFYIYKYNYFRFQ